MIRVNINICNNINIPYTLNNCLIIEQAVGLNIASWWVNVILYNNSDAFCADLVSWNERVVITCMNVSELT